MASKVQRRARRIAQGLALVALAGLSAETLAQQRTRQGTVQRSTQPQRTNTTNVNRNTTVNRNVNRNVDVHVWGRAPVRAGAYAWPRGYAYGRRAVGWIMPRPFLTSAYYYTGWRALGLAAPMAGYQWVRYGPDLLLVQIGTGRVADIRYGVFG